MAVARVLETRRAHPLDKRYLRPDGSRWWGRITRLDSIQGQPSPPRGPIDLRTVTEAEESLRESEAGSRPSPTPSIRWSGRRARTAITTTSTSVGTTTPACPRARPTAPAGRTCSIRTIRSAPGRRGGAASPRASPTGSSTGCGTARDQYRWVLGRAQAVQGRGRPDHALVRHLHGHPGDRGSPRGPGPLARGAGARDRGADRRSATGSGRTRTS